MYGFRNVGNVFCNVCLCVHMYGVDNVCVCVCVYGCVNVWVLYCVCVSVCMDIGMYALCNVWLCVIMGHFIYEYSTCGCLCVYVQVL